MCKIIKVVPCVLLMVLTMFPGFAEAGNVEMVTGWEGNDDQGYGFLNPSYSLALDENRFLVFRGGVNYLYYEFDDLNGRTKVRSPAIEAGVSYRWTGKRISLTVGPGYEVRDTERTFADGRSREDTEKGFNLQGSLFFQATPLTNLNFLGSYSDSNEYIWSRLGIKRQLTNTNFQESRSLILGLEVTGEGNDDTTRYSAGLLFEMAFFPKQLSLQMRLGHSLYEKSDDLQPYFGFGLYKAF
jgi:hypothetical protein